MKKVRDIYTKDPASISEDCSLKEAARIMAAHRVSGMAVTDDEGRVSGFISEHDLVHSAFSGRFRTAHDFLPRNFIQLANEMKAMGDKKVRDFMNRDPVCLTEEQPLTEAAEIILNRGLKLVPVVRERKAVGWLERSRLCDVLMEEPE